MLAPLGDGRAFVATEGISRPRSDCLAGSLHKEMEMAAPACIMKAVFRRDRAPRFRWDHRWPHRSEHYPRPWPPTAGDQANRAIHREILAPTVRPSNSPRLPRRTLFAG